MSINSVSFWQQDQNYLGRAKTRDQSLANTDGLINLMGDAMTNLASGLASIANQTALRRVNNQIVGLLQSAANGNSSSSASLSPSSSTSGSSSSSSTNPYQGLSINSASAAHTVGTAETLLASNGAVGTAVNLLA